jgi:hypothetical protein
VVHADIGAEAEVGTEALVEPFGPLGRDLDAVLGSDVGALASA